MDRTQEIVAFKRDINLTEYAASEGYAVDRKESTAANVVMRDASNDKIMASKSATTGYWLYYSLRDDERGTSIDFIQNRKDLNLGQIRKELRPWMGEGAQGEKSVTPGLFVNEIEPCSRDLDAVVKAFSRMKAETPHAYLIDRGISAEVLFSSRFHGKVFIDTRNNSVFPHYNQSGLTGYEIKNVGFTGFAKHGEKSLWASSAKQGDTAAVFAETAIDAISYAQLHPDPHTRYFSTGGALNPYQPDLIKAAVKRMPEGSIIIIAADHDEGGDRFTSTILKALEDNQSHIVERYSPEIEGMDWNDIVNNPISTPQLNIA